MTLIGRTNVSIKVSLNEFGKYLVNENFNIKPSLTSIKLGN